MLFRSLFVPLHLWLVNDIPPIHPFNHCIPVSLSVVNNLKYVWLGDICMKAGWTHFQNAQDGIWCISLVFLYLCFSSMQFRKCCNSDLPRSCFIPSCLKPSIFKMLNSGEWLHMQFFRLLCKSLVCMKRYGLINVNTLNINSKLFKVCFSVLQPWWWLKIVSLVWSL